MLRQFSISLLLLLSVVLTQAAGQTQSPTPAKEEIPDLLKRIADRESKLRAKTEEVAKTQEESEKAIRKLQRDVVLLEATLKEMTLLHKNDDLERDRQRLDRERERQAKAILESMTTMEYTARRRRAQHATILRLMDNAIITSKLQDVPLKDVLEYVGDFLRSRALDLKSPGDAEPLFTDGVIPILLDHETFLAELGPKAVDPYTEKVTMPSVPHSMRLQLALRLGLNQVAKGQATCLIRQGHLEIVPQRYASAHHLLTHSTVHVTFKRQPLSDVLEDLAEETGLPINLDPNVGKKGDTLISATFRSSPLEDAPVTVSEMADLKFVRLERSILVTTRDRVELLRKEEMERAKIRKDSEAKVKSPETRK